MIDLHIIKRLTKFLSVLKADEANLNRSGECCFNCHIHYANLSTSYLFTYLCFKMSKIKGFINGLNDFKCFQLNWPFKFVLKITIFSHYSFPFPTNLVVFIYFWTFFSFFWDFISQSILFSIFVSIFTAIVFFPAELFFLLLE